MIAKLIDEKLTKDQAERKKSSDKWYPSQFGRCYRAQFWRRSGVDESDPVDLRALRVFAVGNIFHNWIEGLLDCETETPVTEEDVSGRADIVLTDTVLDIKTVHSQKFWHLEKESIIPITERERANFLQVGYYAVRLNKPKCGIVMVSKDDLCISEWIIKTDTIKEQVERELVTLRKIWADGKLPNADPRCYPTYKINKEKKTYTLTGFKECQYCNYRTKCKGEK